MKKKVDEAIERYVEEQGTKPKYLIMSYPSHFELSEEVLTDEQKEELMIMGLGVYNGLIVSVCYDTTKMYEFELAR